MARNFNRIAYAVLFSLISLRLIARAFLPHSYILPDEGMWSSLTAWLVEGKDRTQFDGFDRTPFYGAQSLVIPSAWQVEILKISSLSAVRNTSLLYGIGSLIVFFFVIKMIMPREFSHLSKKQFTFAMGSLLIYGLMPSHLFWSLAGLRDSASEFFVLLTVFFVCKSLLFKEWRWRALPFVTLFSTLSFAARAQTAWILCALVSIIGFASIFKKVKRLELVAIAIIAFFAGQFVSEIPEKVQAREVIVTQGDKSIKLTFEGDQLVKQESNGLSLSTNDGKLEVATSEQLQESISTEVLPKIDEETASQILTSIGDADSGSITAGDADSGSITAGDADSGSKISFEVIKTDKIRTNIAQGVVKPIDRFENLENERAVKRVDAASAIEGPECSRSEGSLLAFSLCRIQEASYQFFAFLFRPLVFENATSPEFAFAAYENLLWLAIFVSLLFYWLKTRWRPSQLDLIPLTFFFLFAPAAAMTQGNLGTAMRHKSIVLWTFAWIAISIFFYHRKDIATHQVASETNT